MKQLQLDALRDIAAEHIPRAQKILDHAKGQPKDALCVSLYGTTVSILATAATPATEHAAALLLQYVMQLSINWEDKLTALERRRIEGCAIEAAKQLCTFTEQTIPWLSNAVIEAPDPEPEAPTPLPQHTTTQQIALPPSGTMLTTEEVAALLNVKEQTVRMWASKQTGPKSLQRVKAGRANTYLADDVIEAMKKGWKYR